MLLTATDRIAEVAGRPEKDAAAVITVWIKQKARNNSRVVLADLSSGQTIGESFLVATDQIRDIRNYQPADKIQPMLRAHHRIAEVQGRSGTVRILQKARYRSRVVPVDLNTAQEVGNTELVASDRLLNIRNYQATAETSTTIRVPTWLLERLAMHARPFETPAEVIARLERQVPLESDNT